MVVDQAVEKDTKSAKEEDGADAGEPVESGGERELFQSTSAKPSVASVHSETKTKEKTSQNIQSKRFIRMKNDVFT